MAESDTALYADPDAEDTLDTSGSPFVERRYGPQGTQITQPNPAAVNLAVWKKIVEAATTSLTLRILQDPKKINQYADDPEKGFMKRDFRKSNERGFLQRFLAEATEANPDSPYMGFVREDENYENEIRKNSSQLHGGTTTESAEEVVAVFSGTNTSMWQSGNENTLVLSPKQIVQISDLILARPEEFAPHQTEASGLYPDDGSGLLDRNTFNAAANLLQTYGAYDSRSYTEGSVQTHKARSGKLITSTDSQRLKSYYLGLTIAEEYYDDGPWAAAREYMENAFQRFFGADEGDYIKRPMLVADGMRSSLESGGLEIKTWSEIKDLPGLDTSGLDTEFKYDSVMFVSIDKSTGARRRVRTYLENFVYRIARNFPGEIQDKLHDIVVRLVEDSEQEDKVKNLLSTDKPKDRTFTGDEPLAKPPEPIPPRDLKPIDLQCFLMENIAMIADYKANQKKPYKNLMQLKAGHHAPGDTISILNCKGKQQEVGELLNLAPSTYAALVPYIKLYRLDYTNADDADSMVPIRQQEIPIPNYMDPEDVARITSGQLGRTSGWGIKSFTWKLDGLQPATVDNNISANLKLYFQSIDDLFKGSRNASGTDQAGRDMAAPLDLLIPSAACREKDDDDSTDDDPPPSIPGPTQTCVDAAEASIAQGRDGACFRIKVVAGWATPPNLEETHPDLKQKVGDETRGQLLRRGLQETRITLYLQQTRHNLTFNENGSCALSIDYQAALSGILTDNRLDILGTNDIYMQQLLKPWKEKAKAAGKDADQISTRMVARGSDAEAIRNDEGYKAAKKKQKEYVKKQIELQNQDKLKKYKRFLSRLYGRHEGGASESPKMYVIEVDPKLVRQKKLADEEDPEKRAKRARQLMTGTHTQRGWAITNPLAYEAGKSGENTNLLDLIGGTDDLEAASEATDSVDEQFLTNLGSGRNMYIPFFYLGDLIDTILQNNKATQFGEGGVQGCGVAPGFMTYMADMDITNPLLLYQAAEDEQDDLMCAARSSINSIKLMEQLQDKGYMVKGGVKKRINIGQIPISLDSFNVWFKNKVIKGAKPSYYLLHFLKDICAQLITDALKATCFNTNIINDIRFDLSHVHYNNREAGGAQIYPNGPLHTVPVWRLAELMGSADTHHRDIPPRNISETEKQRYNLTSGLVLFCTDAHPRNRLGRKGIISDQNIGIYHNYVGSPVGLVKKIGFSRMQQQYLRESKLQKYGNLGAEQLRELYSANLELIGNTLYKNGQYTFLWPSAMTTGDDSRIINLGLGGYFLIKSVSHTIGPSGYNVSMTALQEGMEIGPQPTVTATVIDGDLSPDEGDFFKEDGRAIAAAREQAAAQAAAEEAARIAAAQLTLDEARAAAAAEEENKILKASIERGVGGVDPVTGVPYRVSEDKRLDENLAEGMTPVQAALKARADQLNERFNDDYEAF